MARLNHLGYLQLLGTPGVKVYWGIFSENPSEPTPIADQLALDILDRRRVESFYADMRSTE